MIIDPTTEQVLRKGLFGAAATFLACNNGLQKLPYKKVKKIPKDFYQFGGSSCNILQYKASLHKLIHEKK